MGIRKFLMTYSQKEHRQCAFIANHKSTNSCTLLGSFRLHKTLSKVIFQNIFFASKARKVRALESISSPSQKPQRRLARVTEMALNRSGEQVHPISFQWHHAERGSFLSGRFTKGV